MATRSTDELLARARALPLGERARMVRELIETLDDEAADEAAEQAWAVESEKRAQDVRAGKSVVVETGEMFDRIRNELRAMRGETPQETRRGRSRPKGGGKAIRSRRSRPR